MRDILDRANRSFDLGHFDVAERLSRQIIRSEIAVEQAQGHVLLGRLALIHSRDLVTAEREFQIALVIDPANSSAAETLAALRWQSEEGRAALR